MEKAIRIRTDIDDNKYLKFELNQSYDFFEVLSLKIRQEDTYKLFASDYGVVVGRVLINNGLGVPNAKVSIFIPITEIDKSDVAKFGLYPYEYIADTNSNNIRYNLLPNTKQYECHRPVGTFPGKRGFLDNDVMAEIYDDYYKFTTKTNSSGDFMLFGIPTGTWRINLDVDLSDIGKFSQSPSDFVEEGWSINEFDSITRFKTNRNIDRLPQIFHKETTIDVVSFWGDETQYEVGINRVDLNVDKTIQPHAYFIGSNFGDSEKSSVNKNCTPRRSVGGLCEMVTTEGTIEMLREGLDGRIESFDVDGGRVINENGVWAYSIPMNLDYVTTDEFGNLIPSNDPNIGVPTRAKVRFRVGMDITDNIGRVRTRGEYLIPNNPTSGDNIEFDDYFLFDTLNGAELNDNRKDVLFRDIYWGLVYTVKNYIPRVQRRCFTTTCERAGRFLGIKNVDNCENNQSFPYNRILRPRKPLLEFILFRFCPLILLFTSLVVILNKIITGLRVFLSFFRNIIWVFQKIGCSLSHGPLFPRARAACRCYKMNILLNSSNSDNLSDSEGDQLPCTNNTPTSVICDDSIIPDSDNRRINGPNRLSRAAEWYYCKNIKDDDVDCPGDFYTGNREDGWKRQCRRLPIIVDRWPSYIVLNCESGNGDTAYYMPYKLFGQNEGCNSIDNETPKAWCSAFPGNVQGDDEYADATNINDVTRGGYVNCFFVNLMERLGAFDLVFYNDWVNGSLYHFLFKQKYRRNNKNRFCDVECDNTSNNCRSLSVVDTFNTSDPDLGDSGLLKYYNNKYYYIGSNKDMTIKLFATDLTLLSPLNRRNPHRLPYILDEFTSTTYNRPPNSNILLDDNSNIVDTTGVIPLLFNFNPITCSLNIDSTNRNNVNKICEIGVGLDERRETDDGVFIEVNGKIDNNDIENTDIRNSITLFRNNLNPEMIRQKFIDEYGTLNTNFGGLSPFNSASTDIGDDYFNFRLGISTQPNLFATKNSYYYYFGLHPENNALTELYKKYVLNCGDE